jgi:hypothetical protein
MSEPESIVLEYLRRFDMRQARFEDSLRDMSARLASIESYLATMHGDVARHGGEIEAIKARIDGLSAVSISSAANRLTPHPERSAFL